MIKYTDQFGKNKTNDLIDRIYTKDHIIHNASSDIIDIDFFNLDTQEIVPLFINAFEEIFNFENEKEKLNPVVKIKANEFLALVKKVSFNTYEA